MNPKKEIYVITDASPYESESHICNKGHTGKLKTFSWASATLSVSKQNYSQFEKEALALISRLKNYHKYLPYMKGS